ncbi:RNA-binding S4 domain-containing protein [Varibaculum massiliense]|uniref:RNA-binding S4 domain-containing protein n=1 Tax=Varibaculum massiliense TaxID=1852372 RepID=UPI00288BCFEF|nr:RNA-binding S4 domain-containing protein [Varibaculum massiliense]
MADNNSTPLPAISVRGTIKLGQFLKLANLVEDGAEARMFIQSGDVTVNGEVETRRGSALSPGDIVQINLPSGTTGAQVSC